MKKNYNEIKAIALGFLSVAFLATGGIFVLMSVIPPIATGFYRMLFAVPVFYLILKVKKISIKNLEKKYLIATLLSGVFLGCDLAFWNTAFKYTTVVNANLFTNLVPFIVVPISCFFYKERISKYFVIGLLLTIPGIYLSVVGVYRPSGAEISFEKSLYGDLLAFCTTFFYSAFILTIAYARRKFAPSLIMFFSSVGSAITLFLIMLFVDGFIYPTSLRALMPLIAMALFSQTLGQGLLSNALGKLSVSYSSIILLSQPVIAAFYAFFIFDQRITFKGFCGIFIVLFSIALAKKS